MGNVSRKKEVASLPEFIAKAKKEGCTNIVVKSVYLQEKKFTKAVQPIIVIITFHVTCLAYRNGEEVASFTRRLLSYTLSTPKKAARRELASYYQELKKSAKRMAGEIESSIPKVTIIKTSLKH